MAIPHYGVYDIAGETGLKGVRLMRDRFLAPRVFKKASPTEPEAFEPPARSCGSLRRSRLLRPARRPRHPGRRRAGPAVRRKLRESKRTVVYAELPGAQHAFDVFPSIRSPHIVRAIDRYLHWHWNQYRRESRPAEN